MAAACPSPAAGDPGILVASLYAELICQRPATAASLTPAKVEQDARTALVRTHSELIAARPRKSDRSDTSAVSASRPSDVVIPPSDADSPPCSGQPAPPDEASAQPALATSDPQPWETSPTVDLDAIIALVREDRLAVVTATQM